MNIIILFSFLTIVIVCLYYLYKYKIEHYSNELQNLVLITSVIHTVTTPLSYGKRSIFDFNTRLNQTIETIKSIKNKIPNPYIVLIEGSELSTEENNKLKQVGCNEIYNVSDKFKDIINGPYKSVAEANILLDYLNTLDNKNKYSTISKISGRYYLTSNFDWNKYSLKKALYQCETETRCNTRYYRIPIEYLEFYKLILQKALNDDNYINGKIDIEGYNIFQVFPEFVKLLKDKDNFLGIRGYVAPFGTYIED